MRNIIGYTDTYTGEDFFCKSWRELANKVIDKSIETHNLMRFLPFCNNWNLNYPFYNENAEEYQNRLRKMAIDLQLI